MLLSVRAAGGPQTVRAAGGSQAPQSGKDVHPVLLSVMAAGGSQVGLQCFSPSECACTALLAGNAWDATHVTSEGRNIIARGSRSRCRKRM